VKNKLEEKKITLQKFLDNGLNNTKRRIVSVSAINKADDGTYVFVGKSRLLRPVRGTKNKTDNIR